MNHGYGDPSDPPLDRDAVVEHDGKRYHLKLEDVWFDMDDDYAEFGGYVSDVELIDDSSIDEELAAESYVEVAMPEHLDDARWQYRHSPIVRSAIDHIAERDDTPELEVVRGNLGDTLRVPSAVVFGVDNPDPVVDLPKNVRIVEEDDEP